MMRSLLFLVFCVGFIHANIFTDLFSTESSQAAGITFALRAGDPAKYDHVKGGGSFYEGVDSLDGYYFSCGERASLFIQITTDATYTTTSSSIFSLDLTSNPALKIKAVSNNCGTTSPDSSTTCNTGVSTVLSGNVVQVTKLAKSSRVVVRIDYVIDCSQLAQCSSCAALTLNSYKIGSGSSVSLC
jgi:hypothetical protein